jgi:DNA-binding LacI/PurR family transcriptional regulator
MPVNIYDIAEKAGVSVVTVSRVINNYPNVRENNRMKVLAAMKELDYKPNAAARTLAKGKTGMIGLILPVFGDSFMTQVMASVEKALKEKGMFMVVSTTAGDDLGPNESSCFRLFREERVDGVLIMTPVTDSGYILELKKRNVPCVLLDQHQSSIQVPSVIVDNFDGGYQATLTLIKEGAGKIAHISGPNIYESSKERTRGFFAALSANGIVIDDEYIVQGDFTVACGYNITRNWIERDILPDSVFAADDNTAFGVLDAAREYNIAVPQKLSIIGYDDHPFTSLFHPGISTVRQPAEEMGKQGVELLMEIMNQKSRRINKITLKPSVILRGTTKGSD